MSEYVNLDRHNGIVKVSDETLLMRRLSKFTDQVKSPVYRRILDQLEMTFRRTNEISSAQHKQLIAILEDSAETWVDDDAKAALAPALAQAKDVQRYCDQQTTKLQSGKARGNVVFVEELTARGRQRFDN